MRIFVAVELPDGIREGISELQTALAREGVRDVRWVQPMGIHLTLRFCGEISPETLALLSQELSGAAPVRPFHLRLKGLGVFPPRGKPRVLYLELQDSESLSRLAAWVEGGVVRAGLPPERRSFHPHLTLGRFKQRSTPPRRDSLKAPTGRLQDGFEVDRIAVLRSTLAPAGARYEILATFPLTEAGAS